MKKSTPMSAAFINTDDEVFIADIELVAYIKKKGFVYRHADSAKKYYSHRRKNIQIRIHFQNEEEISFLTPSGECIYTDDSVTKGRLDEFIATGK